MNKWTPGPWSLGEANTTIPIKSGAKTVASVRYGERDFSDARLIAAAPEMAELLADFADACPESVEYSDWPELQTLVKNARALLAKVNG